MLKAFEILGYGPAAHGFTTVHQSKDHAMWEEGVENKFPGSSTKQGLKKTAFGRTEFDQLLGAYEVVSDIPVIVFSAELIEAYPEAKVIVVEREIESWFKSFQTPWTIYNDRFAKQILRKLDHELDSILSLNETITRGWFRAKNKTELLANERDVYREHYKTIREITPPDRLLEFNLKDGWAPLCKFLDKEEPGVPFPKLNDSAEYMIKRKILIGMVFDRIFSRKKRSRLGTLTIQDVEKRSIATRSKIEA